MRVHRGLLGWGVFFIVLGLVPIAVDRGLIAESALEQAWRLWPLILIGAGVGLVLERTRLAGVGGLVIAVTLGLMGGAVLAGGLSFPNGLTGAAGCSSGSGNEGRTPFTAQSGSFGTTADVRFDMNCGELAVNAGDGSGWSLSGASHDGAPPRVSASDAMLDVASPSEVSVPLASSGSGWSVTLPRDPALDLALEVNAGSAEITADGLHLGAVETSVNAGDARLDLSRAAAMTSLDGSVNAGSMEVSLPATSLRVSISVNAGSAEVCVPSGVGVKADTGDNPMGSYSFQGAGLVKTGDTWQSQGYGSATVRIDMDLSANLGSITVNPEGGCG